MNVERTKGISVIYTIIAVTAVIVVLSGYLILKDSSVTDDTDISLKEELQNELGQYGGRGSVSVSNMTDTHLRGNITDRLGQSKDFLALKVGDSWKVVEYDNPVFSCERMLKLNFPSSMVTDCTLEHPEAVTVEGLVNKPKTTEAETVEVLAKVTASDPDCNCITVSSGGDEIEILLPEEDSEVYEEIASLDDGDTVVLTVTVPPDPSSGNGTSSSDNNSGSNSDNNTSSSSNNDDSGSNSSEDSSTDNTINNIVIEDVEEVAPEDDPLVDTSSNTDTNTNTVNDPVDNSSNNDIPDEPTNTPTNSTSNPSFDILDIDNSSSGIKLIND